MKTYRVEIPPATERLIDELTMHIADDSVDHALKWEARLLNAIQSLCSNYGYAIDEDASAIAGRTLRKFVFERTYLIHYEIRDAAGVIMIIDVRHGARLPRRGDS